MSAKPKPLSDKLLIQRLCDLGESFPIKVRILESEKVSQDKRRVVDVLAEVIWAKNRFLFAVEAKLQFTPKAIASLLDRVTRVARELNVNPMILTPYLSEEQLRVLESRQVSGLDLCGNGIIVVPERLLVYRTGNPNQYPSSSPIRNVHRGTSSIVARTFLLRPEFATSQSLLDEITARGGNVTLSTVSKVCSALADDLIIERERQGRVTRLRLLQPDKLADRLAENYRLPQPVRQFTGKRNIDEPDFEQRLLNWNDAKTRRVIRTGTSSCHRYAAMALFPVIPYYCTDLDGLIRSLGGAIRETSRFSNIQLLETDDAAVYYDPRDGINAPPVQAYLELMVGDKRDRETAEQIRRNMLQEVRGAELTWPRSTY